MPSLNAAIDVFLERLAAFGEEFQQAKQDAEGAEKYAADRRARLTEISDEVGKLEEAARVLGFDLFEENQRRWERSQAAAAEASQPEPERRPVMPPPPPQAPKPFKIKDWLLEEARAAYPAPVRAADLRDRLRAMGHTIHDKTVGMTLYRWTQAKAMRRDGLDWFFVPEEHREPVQAMLEGLGS